MLVALLQDHRTINITTDILVIFAGLYTYQSLLGRPGGLLRQLLVGIPLGVAYGVGNYIFDVSANHILSNTFRELVQSPVVPVSSITVGIIGFVAGLTFPLLSPNIYRAKSEYQKLSAPTIVLLFLFSVMGGTLWNSIGIQAIFHLVSIQPPLLIVIAVAFVLSAIAFFYSNSQMGYLGSANETTPVTPKPTLLGCIINIVVLIPVISLWVYFASVVGWGTLVYFVIFAVAGVLITFIQHVVDRLTERGLLEVSLVLFALAAILQLYQAVAS